LNADYIGMGRSYFPEIDLTNFDDASKKRIEQSILADFSNAFKGIKQLPRASRFGVYVAYVYYYALFKKIRNTSSDKVLSNRIRIRNRHKARLLAYSFVKHQLNLI
jgi:phytoene/squalene synthetase